MSILDGPTLIMEKLCFKNLPTCFNIDKSHVIGSLVLGVVTALVILALVGVRLLGVDSTVILLYKVLLYINTGYFFNFLLMEYNCFTIKIDHQFQLRCIK